MSLKLRINQPPKWIAADPSQITQPLLDMVQDDWVFIQSTTQYARVQNARITFYLEAENFSSVGVSGIQYNYSDGAMYSVSTQSDLDSVALAKINNGKVHILDTNRYAMVSNQRILAYTDGAAFQQGPVLAGKPIDAIGETSSISGQVKIYEAKDNGGNYVALKAPTSLSETTTYTLPLAAPQNAPTGLVSDPSGILLWSREVAFSELPANGSSKITLKAPDSLAADSTYILPASPPAFTQSTLESDTAGNTRWKYKHKAVLFNALSITPNTTADFDFFSLTVPANELEALDVVHFDCYGTQQQTNVLLGENRVIEFYIKANTTKVTTSIATLDNNTVTRSWESYGQIVIGSVGPTATIKFSQASKVSGFAGAVTTNNTVFNFNSTTAMTFTFGMRYTSTARATNLGTISSGFIRVE